MPTLLVVEENDAVRTLLRRVLSPHYQVLEARDGSQALRVSGTHPRPIDLLLTDALLPDMTADQLAQQLTAVQPAVKVVRMSGYTQERLQEQGVAPDENFLEKPFTLDQLLLTVRAALGSAK